MSQYDELQKAAAYAAQDTTKFSDEDEEMRALQQFHEEVDPETVLALIAENERLEAINNQMILLECNGGTAQAAINLLEERDQLRAEVAGLRTGYEAYEQVNAELKAEVEKLRKERDARHPFKPFHEPSIGYTGCVICGVYTDHGGLPCPKTRALANALAMENQRITPVEPLRVPHPLDAALGQGEQS